MTIAEWYTTHTSLSVVINVSVHATNIANAKHRKTKQNLFFVAFEPADSNKEIYKINMI